MRKVWKKSVASVLAGLMILAIAGCGGEKKTSDAKDYLKVGVNSFAGSLEPAGNYVGWTGLTGIWLSGPGWQKAGRWPMTG